MKTGTISINTENIFPIIKKFLYSNQEIFLRELISNAVDASQKLKTLSSLGEVSGELGELKVKISINSSEKTITIHDNGIGMTAEEIDKYINQIAFSGAQEFLTKYKDTENQIIGYFGLGFYSAFMVSKQVEIITKSYKDAPAAKWSCDGSTQFTISEADKTERGTDVILHLNDDALEYLENYRIEEILKKYCRFLPISVEFNEKTINNIAPIWQKTPASLQEEDYLKFYEELYPFQEKPLFWIHLNVDYPFTLTGVLYFPKIRPNVEIQKNKIQLYSNQVFITDSVEDVVPDYLALLQGVLDSPDIPLNVSRSYLQTDTNVKKISQHVSKKVADKLHELFTNDREAYTQKWESIGLFVKYGILRDNKFHERAKEFCLYQNVDKKFFTFEEYRKLIQINQTNKDGKLVVLYTTNSETQHTYIETVKNRGYDVLLFEGILDIHFVQFLEMHEENVIILRVDADTPEKLIDKGEDSISVLTDAETEELKNLFEKTLNKTEAAIQCKPASNQDLPVMITRSEYQRRITESANMGMFSRDLPDLYNVVINTNHPLSSKILATKDETERKNLITYSYELALLSQGMLTGSNLTDFIRRAVVNISQEK